ncbi:MAG: diguanylate cyclase [Rhizobacter sp.]|nr:diguanylate cyclase [Rhizobacter sp.]
MPKTIRSLDAHQLQLQDAIQLLTQAGHPQAAQPPAGSPRATEWLQSVIDALCVLSSKDALTGLANRRQFESVLDREIDRVARAGEPALVLMVDIDHFKRVNDAFGHSAGDAVLRAVAEALRDGVRPMDTVARFGGEEFAVILPNCHPGFGQAVAERLLRLVESRSVVVTPGEQVSVTVSIGGAFAPQWVRSSAALWIERADRQLYRAKGLGRNRVCLEPLPVSNVTAEEKGMLFGVSQFQDLE